MSDALEVLKCVKPGCIVVLAMILLINCSLGVKEQSLTHYVSCATVVLHMPY
jgi:hypothetical protein